VAGSRNVVGATGAQRLGLAGTRVGRTVGWKALRLGANGPGRAVQFLPASADAGKNWTAPTPTEIQSPNSPASIKRLPNSANLLAIFNDHSGRFPFVKGKRTPLVAAVSIVAIGGWMLLGEVRRRRSATTSGHGHDHGHDHDPGHSHSHDHAHDLDHAHPHDAGAHPHPHRHPHATASSITWRSLFVLGLAGGLIPSTSALLILLGAIAAGRPAFGLILVVAFGLGMAAVMSGVGLVLVTARDRVDRVQGGIGFGRFREAIPLVASVVVLGFGVVLTGQAWSAIQISGL